MTGPKGYFYAEIQITDQEMFRDEYLPRAEVLLKKFGGTVICRGVPIQLENETDISQSVIVEFDSVSRAMEFYESDEYKAIVDYRNKSSKTRLMILEGKS